MGIIHRLSPHVANCIAAGEVVERPASVVKELAENALDAGASRVTVVLENGGIDRISVTDDGCGMSAEDAKTAFLRHATSKIQAEEDLDGILTLGFRGEALAAISAVSRVELLTRQRGESFGTRLYLEGGEIVEEEETGCPEGTTITVRNLFYNTPARMKFLRKAVSEGVSCAGAITKLALSHPEVSFLLERDGKTVLRTDGDNRLDTAIYQACGREFAADLLTVEGEEDGVHCWGMVTRAEKGRASRGMQYFFLNGRSIQGRTLTAALENAYKGYMTTGKFPGCVLHLACDPEKVDVNVHPSKLEVKFADERAAYGTVYYAIRNALEGLRTGAVTQTVSAAPAEREPEIPAAPAAVQAAAKTFVMPQTPKREPEPEIIVPSVRPVSKTDWMLHSELPTLRDAFDGKKTETPAIPAPPVPRPEPIRPETPSETPTIGEALMGEAPCPAFRVLGTLFATYILAECGDELLICDFHAAHERIRYEELKTAFEAGEKPGAQLLLTPVIVPVSESEMAALSEHGEALAQLGLEAEAFGATEMAVRALPEGMATNDAAALLSELAQAVRLPQKTARQEAILERMACHSAKRAGDTLSLPEQEALLRKILTTPSLRHCPHGRPVLLTRKRRDFEREFER